MSKPGQGHPIRVVAKRTGTPETTLRAWERRYGVVHPERATTGRRLYSDEDIRRLQLIRQALDAGRQISSVATMSDSELSRLVKEDRESVRAPDGLVQASPSGQDVVDACLAAIARMDALGLLSHLNRAILKFPAESLIDQVIAPILHKIGEDWYEHRMSPRHEHMASSMIRTMLARLQAGIQTGGHKTAVVCTPTGQRHELGTQFVAALAASEGWNVVNLGADIPAFDIVTTCREVNAHVVALSIVYPLDDPSVDEALAYLGEHLGPDVHIVVGGQGAAAYSGSIEQSRGVLVASAREFSLLLSQWDSNSPTNRRNLDHSS